MNTYYSDELFTYWQTVAVQALQLWRSCASTSIMEAILPKIEILMYRIVFGEKGDFCRFWSVNQDGGDYRLLKL